MNKETKKKLPFLMPALCIVSIHVVVLVPAAAAHSSGLSGGVEGERGEEGFIDPEKPLNCCSIYLALGC